MAILSSSPRQTIPQSRPRSPLTSDQTRRWLQPLIMIGLGVYFLYNLLSGKIALYVNDAQFGWVPWIGAVLFLAIGFTQAYDTFRTRPHDHADHDHAEDCEDCDHDHAAHDHSHAEHDHDHNHSHAPSWLRLGLVAIPLLIGVIVPAKPLGSSAISTSGISAGVSSLGNLGGGGSASASFTTDPSKRNVLDWVRAFSSSGNISEFSGQTADVTGFVYKDIQFDNKPEFMVARFAVSCCVADASALGVTVQTADAAKWKADSWVHITGKITIDNSSGSPVPMIVADSITPIAQPDKPYLYP